MNIKGLLGTLGRPEGNKAMCYRDDDRKPLSGEEWRDIFRGVVLVLFMVAAVIAVAIIHHPAVGR